MIDLNPGVSKIEFQIGKFAPVKVPNIVMSKVEIVHELESNDQIRMQYLLGNKERSTERLCEKMIMEVPTLEYIIYSAADKRLIASCANHQSAHLKYLLSKHDDDSFAVMKNDLLASKFQKMCGVAKKYIRHMLEHRICDNFIVPSINVSSYPSCTLCNSGKVWLVDILMKERNLMERITKSGQISERESIVRQCIDNINNRVQDMFRCEIVSILTYLSERTDFNNHVNNGRYHSGRLLLETYDDLLKVDNYEDTIRSAFAPLMRSASEEEIEYIVKVIYEYIANLCKYTPSGYINYPKYNIT